MAAIVPEAGFSPVDLQLRDGQRVTLRAVRPQDRDALQAAIKGLSQESRYTRFMSALRELSPQMLERAVNPEKQRHLIRVAREYARKTDTAWERVRFDIVSIVLTEPPAITLLRGAFR